MQTELELAAQATEIDAGDDLPILGHWYYVWDKDDKKEYLACCTHIGSNHAKFTWHDDKWESTLSVTVMYKDWHKCRPAADWREKWNGVIAESQVLLMEAVQRLSAEGKSAGVTGEPTGGGASSLVVATDPAKLKAQLCKLKDETLPATQKLIKDQTKKIVAANKNLYRGMMAVAEHQIHAIHSVNDRLFALELYAGFNESIKQIAYGEQPPAETPIHIFQGLRYMDEETLIAAEDGGMSFGNLEAFDAWAANNLDQVAPRARCIVAFKVRRKPKDYGICGNIETALQHINWHKQDAFTYLLIRNGGQAFRISTELEFEPRLIPLRGEFEGELEKAGRFSYDEVKTGITPADYEYDAATEERKNKLKHANRILFIVQGLLDRSEAFNPHPKIDLGGVDAQKWLLPIRDEEDGLPASGVPEWKAYQALINQGIKKGDVVYAIRKVWNRGYSGNGWYEYPQGWFRVDAVSRNGFTIKASMSEEIYSCKWRKDRKVRRHYKFSLEQVFNCSAYPPGDYKRFLCDARTKGEYLKWAPFLLNAERFHKLQAEEKESI